MTQAGPDTATQLLVVNVGGALGSNLQRALGYLPAAQCVCASASEALGRALQPQLRAALIVSVEAAEDIADLHALLDALRTRDLPTLLICDGVPAGLELQRRAHHLEYLGPADEPALVVARLRLMLELTAHRQEVLALQQQLARQAERLGEEITARGKAEARLQHQATNDPLTELPNRELFGDRLQTALARADRSGQLLALLQLEIVDQQAVRDCYGGDVADRLLRAVAQRLIETARRSDTVAYLGGEQFAVVAEAVVNLNGAMAAADKLLDVLALPFSLPQGDGEPTVLHVRARAGLAIYPTQADAAPALIATAEAALASAREQQLRLGLLEKSAPG